MPTQLPLFEIPDEVQGKVYFDGTRYVAEIGDWWIAYGATEAEAVKRVTENYHREMDKA